MGEGKRSTEANTEPFASTSRPSHSLALISWSRRLVAELELAVAEMTRLCEAKRPPEPPGG